MRSAPLARPPAESLSLYSSALDYADSSQIKFCFLLLRVVLFFYTFLSLSLCSLPLSVFFLLHGKGAEFFLFSLSTFHLLWDVAGADTRTGNSSRSQIEFACEQLKRALPADRVNSIWEAGEHCALWLFAWMDSCAACGCFSATRALLIRVRFLIINLIVCAAPAFLLNVLKLSTPIVEKTWINLHLG